MTQVSSTVTSPMQRRLAARRLDFDDELDSNAPDSAGVQPTVLAAPPEGRISVAAQPGSADGKDLGMRRDLDSMMAQITALSSVVHSALAQQVQQQSAAAPQPRMTAEGGQPLINEQQTVTERPRAALQHSEVGEESTQAVEQQCEGSKASVGRNAAQECPFDGDSCQPEQETAVSARELECPISALQTLMWYEEHDPPLHRDSDKRCTVNGPTLYDHLDDSRSDVTAALEAAVSEPGPQVEAAMNEFVSAVTAAVPGGRMAQHSVFSLLVEGYKRCGSESVVEDARGLVVNAVARSRDLGALVAEIRSEGVFDREISEENEKNADMPGFIDFDPGTGAGRMRWRQLRELFEVYFGQSAEPAVQEQQAKVVWENIRLISVSVFIPCEKKAFRRWRQAGGDVTDATRIEDVKARFGPKLAPAYARHVESEACAGRREEMLEKKWGLFCKVMERCGRAVGPENEAAYDAALRAAGRSAGDQTGQNTTDAVDGKEQCWDWLSMGKCNHADNCRFSHDGVAGSRRGAVVDRYGNCRQFAKHGDCRRKERGECPFLHKAKDEQLSSEQHAAIIAYSDEKQKDPTEVSWGAVAADGAEKWVAKGKEPGARQQKLYPILQQRKRYKAEFSMDEAEAMLK
jgi:hypothetical protein